MFSDFQVRGATLAFLAPRTATNQLARPSYHRRLASRKLMGGLAVGQFESVAASLSRPMAV